MKAITIDRCYSELELVKGWGISDEFIYRNIANNYSTRYRNVFAHEWIGWGSCLMRNEKSNVNDVDSRDICGSETSNKLCVVLSRGVEPVYLTINRQCEPSFPIIH